MKELLKKQLEALHDQAYKTDYMKCLLTEADFRLYDTEMELLKKGWQPI